MDETTPPVPDTDSPLWDAAPEPEDTTDEAPTAEPPSDWDPEVHLDLYVDDPAVDTSPVPVDVP